MHDDHKEYFKFTGRARLDKAVNSLIGLIEGISIDGQINEREIAFLNFWLRDNGNLRKSHPYNELIPVVEQALTDNVLSDDERQDILWLCEKLRSTEYYDVTTTDIQRLHTIMAGIISDGIITKGELTALSSWLINHDHLKSCWPYDEVDRLITSVLSDGRIDDIEQKMLKQFFSEFIVLADDKTITSPTIQEGGSLVGVCSVCPEITFTGMKFCFTGASYKYTRSEFSHMVSRFGGEVVNSVSNRLNYLVIGADGNPCWSYACYGRKVEKAVELRKQGTKILLVHENDFHDAVADML